MKRIYLLFLLLISYLVVNAQPSATSIPNPAGNPDIIPSSSEILSVYGTEGTTGTFGSNGGLTITPYGTNNEGVYFDGSWAQAYLDISGTALGTGDQKYKKIYFVYGGTYSNDIFLDSDFNGWQKVGFTSTYIDNGWTLCVVDIPDEASTLNKIYFQSGENGLAYVANICLTNYVYTPPVNPVPTDYLTPPNREPDEYFSFFNDLPYGISTGGSGAFSQYYWNSESSEYEIAQNQSAQKIVITGHGALSFFFDGSPDVSTYTHVHFDVWPAESMSSNELIIALYKDGAVDNDRSDMKFGNIPAEAWSSFDIKLEDFTNDIADNLSALKQVRFETSYTNSTAKTYYIDNIYFYSETIDPTTPSVPAYLPPIVRDDATVKSVFSDSYTAIGETPTINPTQTDILVENNNVWKFETTDNISLSFDNAGLDISNMTHIHLDIWTQTAANITINLNNSVSPYAIQTANSNWIQLDIPITHFGAGITAVNSLSITGDNNTYFVDNIYFYKYQEQFEVDINAFNASLKKGINLGDIFDVDPTEISRWDPEYLKMIKKLGFSHVRLPVHWESYGRSMNSAPYNIDPVFINEIKDIVDEAIKNELRIIINLHHHSMLMKDPDGQKDRFIAQWAQIADYFQHYPDSLIFEVLNEPYYNMTAERWNDFLVYGIDAIRESNPTRPVMIGVSGGGGIDQLKDLDLPAADENLIVTIHYYNPSDFTHQGAEWSDPIPPVGTEWLDTDMDRLNVETDFQLIENFLNNPLKPFNNNRPIHIGEFGVYEKADMDSRVRWTTYIARYIEQKGYSWAYWDFDAKFGIYDPVNKVYRQPLVDALQRNPIPEETTQVESVPSETLYDSNETGTAGFDGWGYSNISKNDKLVVTITDGGSEKYGAQIYLQQGLQKGVTYKASFTVSAAANDNNFFYQSYFMDKSNTDYIKYSQTIQFEPTTVPTPYSYTFTVTEEDNENVWLMFDVGGSETTPITLTFEDIKIETREIRFQIAAVPGAKEKNVNNILSSKYTNDKTLTYSKPAQVGSVKDMNGGVVTLFSDFDAQTITLPANLYPASKKMLHMEAYAGSPLELEVSLSGSISKTVSYPLPSHEWTSLDIDLSDVVTSSTDYISSINLSGGTGSGRKLYVDHIYLYDNRNIWLGTEDSNWNNADNWSSEIIPDSTAIVYLAGGRANYPVLSAAENNYSCQEIYFLPGAQLGRSDLLTYKKAHVQMNFGLLNENAAQETSTDIDEHLKHSAHYSGTPITRSKWHMLSMPLSKVLTGDMSFGGHSGTYLKKFDVTKSVSGNILKANWTDYYTTTIEEFKPAEGFIYWMHGYQDKWPYREYGIDNTNREYGLQQVNGIVELPYYEDEDMSRAHRIHEYNAETNVSTFCLFSSSTGNFTGGTQKANRGTDAYRFIFEKDAANSPNVLYPVTKPAEGNLALVGNPYMSAIDFNKFYEDNDDYIEAVYQLWTGDMFNTYNAETGATSGDVANPINQYIAPMQSFLVQLRDDFPAGGTNLVFNIENITPASLTSSTPLKAKDTANDNMLTIIATNNSGSVKTYIAGQEEGSQTYSELEGNKLISTIRNIPDIYLLKPSDSQSNTMTGVPYAIIGDEQTELPLALATNLQGKTTFTFTGMDQYNAVITFIDQEEGFSKNITDMDVYEYEFDYTPSTNTDNAIVAKEDRFRIRFAPRAAVGIEQPENTLEDILIYNNNGYINVITTEGDQIQQVSLYDVQGKILFKNTNINGTFYQIPNQMGGHPLLIIEVVTNKETKRIKINTL